jgi:hypothetical protein
MIFAKLYATTFANAHRALIQVLPSGICASAPREEHPPVSAQLDFSLLHGQKRFAHSHWLVRLRELP